MSPTWREKKQAAQDACNADDRVLDIDGVPHIRDVRYPFSEVWRRADGTIEMMTEGVDPEGEDDDDEEGDY